MKEKNSSTEQDMQRPLSAAAEQEKVCCKK
jgi:hypothetical protein